MAAESTDEIIGGIFGDGWDNLFSVPALDGTTGGILGQLLGVFSISVIGITIFVVGVVFMTALAETANKGQLAGRYANMWLPIRSVAAPVLIFPISNGYSLIQMILLAGVVNIPISLADLLSVTAATAIVERGETFANPSIRQVAGVGNQMMYSAVCTSYYNNIEYSNSNRGRDRISLPRRPTPQNAVIMDQDKEYFTSRANENPSWIMSFSRISQGRVSESQCGEYVINCQDSDPKTRSMCLEQATALYDMAQQSLRIADDFIINRNLPEIATVARIQAEYESKMNKAVQKRILGNLGDEDKANRKAFIEDVKRQGFFGAGSYYMTITQISDHNARFGQPNIVVLPMKFEESIDQEIGIAPYLNRARKFIGARSNGIIAGAEYAEGEVAAKQRELARIGHGQGSYPGQSALSRASSAVVSGVDVRVGDTNVNLGPNNPDPLALFPANTGRLVGVFNYDDEPITGIQSLGNTLLTISSAFFAGAAVADLTAGKNPLAQGLKTILSSGDSPGSGILSGITTVMMVAFFLGAVLLYYVPSVPFIIWTMGVVGYLLTIFETLIAATLWIASHVMPQGEGLSSDQARQGYSLLLNVGIRPPLMVIGLYGGAAVMHVATAYFIPRYHFYVIGLMSNRLDMTGIFTWIFLTAIEVSLVVAIIHKTHSAIFEAPDNIVRWISTMVRPTGEDASESRVAAVFQSTSQRAESIAHGSVAGAGSARRPSDNLNS